MTYFNAYNPYAYSRRRTCSAPACMCESPCDAYYYGDGSERRGCRGPEDQCEGCDDCTEVVQSSKTVIARAPRTDAGRKRRAANGIEPGDRIRVTRVFDYQKNGGPRLGYFYQEYLVEKRRPEGA